eukprot:6201410-Pleurochrysis_carterae.AAC.4
MAEWGYPAFRFHDSYISMRIRKIAYICTKMRDYDMVACIFIQPHDAAPASAAAAVAPRRSSAQRGALPSVRAVSHRAPLWHCQSFVSSPLSAGSTGAGIRSARNAASVVLGNHT